MVPSHADPEALPEPSLGDAGQGPATGLVRLAAIGAVDDGKSTLIGRLLHDSRLLLDDQLQALGQASAGRGLDEVDLAFVTDGLRAERDQGITIDVAYRYAATPRQKLVIADCPGHLEYTRNMATAASTADAVMLVVDARTGIREQTSRHLCVAALFGVGHLVVAVNKMDLVDWSEATFAAVTGEVGALAQRVGLRGVQAVPVSALKGDYVVEPSSAAPWYGGATLTQTLERFTAAPDQGGPARLPIQWVIPLPGGGQAYAGRLIGCGLRPGEEVVALPGGQHTRLAALETFDGPVGETTGLSVTAQVVDHLDLRRGDLLASAAHPPQVVTEVVATLCWFAEQPLVAGARYGLKHTSRTTGCRVQEVSSVVDVTGPVARPAHSLGMNDIGRVRLAVEVPLATEPYRVNRTTGSFIVVDEASGATLGAGMVGPPLVPI